MNNEKCLVCFRLKPKYREKNVTCSKKCSNAWIWLPRGERERRRTTKYLKKSELNKIGGNK